ncbi:SAM-dependent methyltransferase TRM5/TYW2-type [Dillenia turbinata]|uniref:tRNA (guanine(37)-N1)-methyltransferase n=1 Tax=Dillenia turbinata TaxID=194707 RepID=A0AAN8ZVJ9_9MAGN
MENRLRGHLLNRPRIKNIARVPGDEIDDKLKNLVPVSRNSDEEERLVVLNRRTYGKDETDGGRLSPVLYRDEIVRTFNYGGYVKYRNLEKLTRPKKRKKKEGGERRGIGRNRNEFAVVKVVEDEEDDLRDSWILVVVANYQYSLQLIGSISVWECFVRTLFTADCKILEALLPDGMTILSAFETVGHIAHLNLRDEHLPYKNIISKVVLDKNKPKIQTVVNKVDPINNEYRTMQLEVLVGNHSLVTTVVENGIHFQVDLVTVYSPCDMKPSIQFRDVFSGVGPIAISAAKKVKHVYANDLNPYAVEYLEKNCVLNKLGRKIEVFNMNGRRFIDAIFSSPKVRSIIQVVMNLPKDAAEFLGNAIENRLLLVQDAFRGIFRNRTRDKEVTCPKIPVYGFSKAEDPEYEFDKRIRTALSKVAVEIEMHRVRLVAPGKWTLCASFVLPMCVAFAKPLEDV